MFEKYKVDNLQGLIVNYLTAAIFSYFFLEPDFSISNILKSDWLYHAMIIGTLFIIVFNFYAFGTQKAGIAITTVANKMSLIIPVCAAFILNPEKENLNYLIIISLLLTLIGIYLSSTKGGKLGFDKKYLWIIILVFVGQGISDLIFANFAPKKSSYSFFMTIFFIASLSGIIIHKVKSIKTKTSFHVKNLFWGVIFGIPNFFSLVFFLEALKTIEHSIVFPLVSMGVIISSSLLGMLLFNEKISKTNWIGILLSVCAISLLICNKYPKMISNHL
jgi:uncharacterized membrane protein